MEKLNGASMDIVGDNIQKLKSIFPEIFSEDKIDFNALKAVLGEHIDTENERYSFNWHGKSKARKIAQESSTGTLLPSKDESKDWNNTDNLYIEGDNLEVLKLLQKSYHNKVKMIYIDPPYNTGKDFVYPDNFKDNLKNYLEITGQVGEEGQKLSTNSDTSGRYHSDWLNMMYPRLKLARNLLTDDGVIFISIDDNEQSNLKKLCDEIFGENNFIGSFIKQSKIGGGSDSKYIVKEHEELLVYTKKNDDFPEMFEEHDLDYLKRYKEEDDRGKYFWDTFARPGLKNPIIYEVIAPDGTIIKNGWIRSKERFEEEYKNGIIKMVKKENGEWSVQFKQYLNMDGKKPRSMTTNFGGTIIGKKELLDLLKNDKIFSYPKSTKFLMKIMKFGGLNNQDLILDFFSGSATTAHATMQLNAEDGGNRKYIMVQLPEPTAKNSEASKAGYKNICEIGKERIRRAGEKVKSDETLPLENREKLDVGFKVFKLDTSNIKEWDSET
ncbi:MAG: site-specific DNA-methyltransferase, partial [Fusobacteriaceae bacterium]